MNLLYECEGLMFKRSDAIDMKIGDSEDTSGIVKVINIDDYVLIIKEKSIYKLLLAESIDIKNEFPDTRHSQEKLFNIGANSQIISRILIQSNELLEKLDVDKMILNHIWDTNKNLINCYIALSYIKTEINRLTPECEKIIESNKAQRYIPALPQISELESKVHQFYNNAKLFLIKVFKLFQYFFYMPIAEKKEANFHNHIEWIKSQFGEHSGISKMLNDDSQWIRILSECRNAIEHPEEGQKLKVTNFSIQADNKFSQPLISYDLSKKMNLKVERTLLYNELKINIENLTDFFEDILVVSINELLKDNKMLSIYKKKKDDINPLCQVFYEINLAESFLQKNKI